MELAKKYYEQKHKQIDESVHKHIQAKELEFFTESGS